MRVSSQHIWKFIDALSNLYMISTNWRQPQRFSFNFFLIDQIIHNLYVLRWNFTIFCTDVPHRHPARMCYFVVEYAFDFSLCNYFLESSNIAFLKSEFRCYVFPTKAFQSVHYALRTIQHQFASHRHTTCISSCCPVLKFSVFRHSQDIIRAMERFKTSHFGWCTCDPTCRPQKWTPCGHVTIAKDYVQCFTQLLKFFETYLHIIIGLRERYGCKIKLSYKVYLSGYIKYCNKRDFNSFYV